MFTHALITLALMATAPTPAAEATRFDEHAATVLLFISTDCPIANGMAPAVARLHEEFAKQDVAFYRVYADAMLTDEAIAQHGKDFSLPMPAVRDGDLKLVQLTGATITPEAVVFDREGKRRYRGRINNRYEDLGKYRQKATQHDLRDALDALLAGREVKDPETKAVGCFLPTPKDAAPAAAQQETTENESAEPR
jgi:hypothetical protein